MGGYLAMTEPVSRLHTHPTLLMRLRDPRDGEAWQRFVEVYGPLIYSHGRRKNLSHEDAEDLTQRIFADVTQAIRTFTYRPEIGRFRDWLGTVVRHEIGRILRKRSREPHGRGGDQNEPVLDNLEARGEDTEWTAGFNAHILQTALARARPHFAAESWQAFERVWLEHRPAAEVAKEMGRRVGWVYVVRSRVLKRLWQEVEELSDNTSLGLMSLE